MASQNHLNFASAVGMGVVAGMRSMAAPALVSDLLSRGGNAPGAGTIARFFASPATARTLTVLAGGEMIVDKLPGVPDRISPPALAGRLISGALAGTAIAQHEGRAILPYALSAAAVAAASAFATYHARQWIGRATDAPDPFLGLIEDTLVLGAGRALLACSD